MIFGIGTDIVEVSRIEASLAKFGAAFVHRILAATELAQYHATPHKARFLAKRFAAKEALAKALGTGLRAPATFHDIAVTHDAAGKPLLEYSPALQEYISQQQIVRSHLTISDEKALAVAFVVLETA